jgi:hypothetical protein
MNHKGVTFVSAGLAGCMFVHAAEGLSQGKAPSEVHLVTSAPLVPASTASGTASMDYVQHNAIYDAVYNVSVPRQSELRLGGLMITLA